MEKLKVWFLGLSIGKKIALIFVTLLVIIIVLGQEATQKQQTTPLSPEAERQTTLEHAFNPIDGSHRNLTAYVKQHMNDPASYEHVETTYIDRTSYLLLEMKFRGKNAMGAKVLQTVTAKATLDGELIEVGMK